MRIVFFGDSITDAGRNREDEMSLGRYGYGFVHDVSSTLMYQEPNKYQIYNRGIGGNRSIDLYARIKNDLWNLQPDLISLYVGVNDLWHEIKYKNGLEVERFEKIYKINVFGAFHVTKIFLPLLKSGSRILLTTSELAPLDPLPFTGIYAITKSALDNYAFSLRMELQLLNIDVCVLRAGAVKTEMLGVSTSALDRFCENTTLYECNAKRFKQIVERVEARNIPPEKLAKKVVKILHKQRTKFAYTINRNPLLLLLNVLPKRWQLFAIKCVLKKKKEEK